MDESRKRPGGAGDDPTSRKRSRQQEQLMQVLEDFLMSTPVSYVRCHVPATTDLESATTTLAAATDASSQEPDAKPVVAVDAENGEVLSETPASESDRPKPAKRQRRKSAPLELKNGSIEAKKICQSCESPGEVVRCEGGCQGLFHPKCMSPAAATECHECATGSPACFACKSAEGEMERCVVPVCRKAYHSSCLATSRAVRIDAKGRLKCPLHSCLACVLAGNKKTACKGPMYRCIRCPVAYHSREACAAAGSTVLSKSVIVCPLHYRTSLGARSNRHVNVNWCFMCSLGGSLICCETCPASFHAECLNIEPPEGSYFCIECQLNVQPKYGDIVWAKMSRYRWWPAKVCSPRTVPVNIQNISHKPGEFPVRFFGTYDYYWTRRSRTFQFLEGDRSTRINASSRLSQTFNTAMKEAVMAFQKLKSAKESKEAQNHRRHNLKPPAYKHIEFNRPVGKAAAFTVADPSQVPVCDCNPNAENPCGSDSECLNRLLLIECNPDTCPASDRCQNQRFEKMQYVKAEVFRTEGKGWGLRCLEDIRRGQFVNEYVGEIIDEDDCQRRMRKMHEENDTSYYFLTLDKDRIIDAGKKGNLSRFMNHSCQPNCELHKWTVNADTRVGLFALSDIPSGTELTFNYNLDCLGNEKTICHCGATNCSMFIGERPKALTAIVRDKMPKIARRKRSKAGKVQHENECFRCGLDGQLLLCDRKNCTKAYHLGCLDLKKIPHNKWDCPWHHCDVCGKTAAVLCSCCPNSFCSEHDVVENARRLSDGTVLCHEHTAEQFLSLQQRHNKPNSDKNSVVAPDIEPSCEEDEAAAVPVPVKEEKSNGLIVKKQFIRIRLKPAKKTRRRMHNGRHPRIARKARRGDAATT